MPRPPPVIRMTRLMMTPSRRPLALPLPLALSLPLGLSCGRGGGSWSAGLALAQDLKQGAGDFLEPALLVNLQAIGVFDIEDVDGAYPEGRDLGAGNLQVEPGQRRSDPMNQARPIAAVDFD